MRDLVIAGSDSMLDIPRAFTVVIGVDPGATTGLCAFTPGGDVMPMALQIHGPEGVTTFVESLMNKARTEGHRHLLAVEAFIIGGRASRSSHPEAGRTARALIAALEDLPAPYVSRSASQVKPWATDERLEAAGLLQVTHHLPHARDAARHALYAAVREQLMRDPLSGKAKAL